MIESHGITIIRTNPDAADFNMYRLINQIHKHIAESNKEKVEKEKELKIKNLKKKIKEQGSKIKEQKNKRKEQKSKFAKELLRYVSRFSMQVTHIKHFVKKLLPTLSDMKNTQSKIKPIKMRKQPGSTYCFGCKD